MTRPLGPLGGPEAATAADERDRHPLPDLEEWDRTLPFGAVELALAIN